MARVPVHFLAYPVLVNVAGSFGSGFFLNADDALYLVSASHVLFRNGVEVFDGTNGGPVKLTFIDSRDQLLRRQIVMECRRLFDDGNLRKHQTGDVAVCRIAQLRRIPDQKTPIGENFLVDYLDGIDVADEEEASLSGLHLSTCQRFQDVGAGGDIILFGYPTSLAGNTSFEKATPLLRTGIVAGKTSNEEIVIDCPVYFGNSGALVVEATSHAGLKPLGVAVRMIPFVENLYSKEFRRDVGTRYENSGYAIVEPMDRVFDLIEEIEGKKVNLVG